jgi:type III pantothenate kinase
LYFKNQFLLNARVLVIDIGNTRVKTALVHEDIFTLLPARTNLTTAWLAKLFAACEQKKERIEQVVLCSVKNENQEIIDWLTQNCTIFLPFSTQIKLPIRIAYSTPNTLGKDRLAAILGAWAAFPQRNTLVIDAGTCIKYDIITDAGVYLGGSIAPGIGMRLRAMHEFTAKLPLVECKMPIENFIGNSTETAIRTGAQLAAALEARGFIELYKTNFENLNVVLTGGDAIYLKPHLPSEVISDKILIMKGLYAVLK